MFAIVRVFIVTLAGGLAIACAAEPQRPAAAPLQHVVLITIDTLRADHVGVFGTGAPTPAMQALAFHGVSFDRAYATSPVTLPSHASLMTGRYPPGHGARHNGLRMDLKTPTLAEAFARAGFATAAFVAAFPLDRRFGLIKGFQTYGDTMPRDARGRPANERRGHVVVDEALAWVAQHRGQRIFLWVHLFEPHAPYGNPEDPAQAARSPQLRYRDEVIEADRQVGRLVDGLGFDPARTLVVVTADHGEAFGEHGEISHSLFAYDTTLRVPLIISGAGLPALPPGRHVHSSQPVSLVDVAPTLAAIAGLGAFDSDGRDLRTTNFPGTAGDFKHEDRSLYAETFAPLLDFGWSPLRTIRAGRWKYIAAPKPEIYDLAADPGETRNLIDSEKPRAAGLGRQIDAISPASVPAASSPEDREARARLQALGYASGGGVGGGSRPDPKDRKELAAQIARVASGDLSGAPLERALRDILRADAGNPQANVRLGYVLLEAGRCAEAIRRFTTAIDGHLPSADAHLGRAACETAAKNFAGAIETLTAAQAIEPDNPVVIANLGLVTSDSGRPADAIPHLQRSLSLDPNLHHARFGLAVAYARSGRRGEAAKEAQELLRRLPPNAPQRPEVERLLAAVR
jgi:choline-sulfatase